MSFPGHASGKESTSQCKRPKEMQFIPWVWKIPWSRKWHPTLLLLPGKFHGAKKSQRWLSDWECDTGSFHTLTIVSNAAMNVGVHNLSFHIHVLAYFRCVPRYIKKSPYILCWCSVLTDSLWPHGLLPTGSSVHGTFQARILEWVAFSFCRGSSWLRDQTHVSCISCSAGRFFTTAPPGKPKELVQLHIKNDFKMDRRPRETFLQRKHSDG